MEFLCSGCGSCCRRVSFHPDYKHLVDEETGWCKHLQPDNSCEIYEDRPDICNVEKGFQKSDYEDRTEYYKMNNQYCNQFQEEDGMDESYRINIKDYD